MSDKLNWVKARAECTACGFLRRLREEIGEDIAEANRHHDPTMSFSLTPPSNEKMDFNEGLRVARKASGEKTDDAFVVYKPMEGDKIQTS